MRRLAGLAILTVSTLAALPLQAAEPVMPQDSSGGLPQFNPHWFPGQIFWLAISFSVLYTIFSMWILPAIGGTLENRRQKVESDIAAAERMKSEAEAAHISYEVGLNHARAEATQIVDDVHNALKVQGEARVHAFRQTMETEMAALEGRLTIAKKAAMGEMNIIAAELASEAARKIVGISFDPQKAHSVIEALNRREAA